VHAGLIGYAAAVDANDKQKRRFVIEAPFRIQARGA
jgi:hypothetical protein